SERPSLSPPTWVGTNTGDGEFNLPGLWFSESEVYALLLTHSLLDQLQPGFVREQLEPFEAKLRALLAKPARGAASILDRMHVSAGPQRPVNPHRFKAICDGTLRRKKLRQEATPPCPSPDSVLNSQNASQTLCSPSLRGSGSTTGTQQAISRNLESSTSGAA